MVDGLAKTDARRAPRRFALGRLPGGLSPRQADRRTPCRPVAKLRGPQLWRITRPASASASVTSVRLSEPLWPPTALVFRPSPAFACWVLMGDISCMIFVTGSARTGSLNQAGVCLSLSPLSCRSSAYLVQKGSSRVAQILRSAACALHALGHTMG